MHLLLPNVIPHGKNKICIAWYSKTPITQWPNSVSPYFPFCVMEPLKPTFPNIPYHDKTCLLSWQKVYLSQQTYYCHDKTFVMTNICHNKHNFVATSLLLSWQTCVCHKKICLSQQQNCHGKCVFVMTNILSWQT